MDQEQVLRDTRKLIENVFVAYLSTVDAEGYPQTRAVFNLRCQSRFPGMSPLLVGHESDFLLYFTTNTSSQKVAELAARPRACAYFCQPEDAYGALLTGQCELVEDRAIKDACWHPGWERYYPGGPTDPDYAILRMRPERVKGWYHNGTFAYALPATT
jgi:general stress protein 26